VDVGVDVPKIITRAVSIRLGVRCDVSGVRCGVSVGVGRKNAVCVNVAVGKTKPPLPPCPPPTLAAPPPVARDKTPARQTVLLHQPLELI
jgi:hypothetical protein